MSHSSTQGQGSGQNEQAFAPHGAVVRVTCGKHPLAGLFVIWAALSEDNGGEANSSPDAALVAVADEYDPLPSRFVLGVVDRAGYLQPVLPDKNPWHAVFLDKLPHTFKLGTRRSYRFCLLRHPSPELARALVDYLNDEKGEENFDVDGWGGKEMWGGDKLDKATLIHVRKLEPAPQESASKSGRKSSVGGGAEELLLRIPESREPKDYWPKGHALYGGWTLYPDMPNIQCENVKQQVEKLQFHLGTLRYPISFQEQPYRPEEKTEKIPTGNRGIFDARTATALVRFQEHAALGAAFKVTTEARSVTHAKLVDIESKDLKPARVSYTHGETWNYLLGEEVRDPTRFQNTRPALVDVPTGEAIKHWLQNGYRKPGKLLLRVVAHGGASICLREDVAVQLEVWRRLVEAFGCAYQEMMPSGHSFRDITLIARGVAGVLNNSIHKTGMAIDFALRSINPRDTDFTRPAKYWPIRIEQRFGDSGKDPTASARKQLVFTEEQKKKAEAQLKVDRDLQAKHAATSPPPASGKSAATPAGGKSKPPEPPPAAESTTIEEAKKASTLAKGQADTHRKAAINAMGKASKLLAEHQRATAALDLCVRWGEAYLRALDKEIELRKAEIEDIQRENARTKFGYRMRWCLYGHSKLDVFGPGRKEALEGLLQKMQSFGADMETHLAAKFDRALQTPAKAWIESKAKQYLQFETIGKDLASALATREGREGLVDRYFREAIRPFLFNPYEADGGTSLSYDLTPARDKPEHIKKHPVLVPFEGEAKSYLSLTALGHLCGMLGIGTAGTKWKVGFETLKVAQGFGKLVELIRAASEHQDTKDLDVVIARAKGVLLKRKPADLDIGFMESWASALSELSLAPGAAPKPQRSQSLSVQGAQITVALPPPELKDDASRLLAKLQGDFASKRFLVVRAGQETGMHALAVFAAMTGKDVGAQLEAAFKAFEARLVEERTKNKKDVKKRDRSWIEVTLQPVFERSGSALGLSSVGFIPADQVQVSAPGIPRTLEWWHYQSRYAMGGSWSEQVEEIGFSQWMLHAPAIPPEQEGGDFDGRGLGYSLEEMESTRGGVAILAEPSNSWTPPPEGW